MPTCSQCAVHPATYQVDSSVLCQPCLALTEYPHSVSRLKHNGRSAPPRIDLRAMQHFRRRVAAGEFSALAEWMNDGAAALAAAVASSPTQTGPRFRPNFVDRTIHFVRRIFRRQYRG